MIRVPVVNTQGDEVSSLEIDPAEFGGSINRQLLHDAVVMYEANKRQGTHSVKRRGEIAGSKKKLFRQKGTGHARAGSKRTNKRRGGGSAMGPKPRDYSYQLPKKARRLASRMALLSKLQDHEAVVVDALGIDEPKTKEMAAILKTLGLSEQTCLISTDQVDRNVYLSARNIAGVEILPATDLNAYSLLRRKRLLMTLAALERFRKLAADTPTGKASGTGDGSAAAEPLQTPSEPVEPAAAEPESTEATETGEAE